MNRKINALIFGSVVLGSLVISSGPAMARDDWRWSERDHRWERRAELRSDHRALEAARRQLDYDIRHGASRRRIAQDRERIREIEAEIRADRRDLARR